MKTLKDLEIKIFSDGADVAHMLRHYREGLVKGFTTNPTLMHQAGLTDYVRFAHEALAAITDLPISFEVFSDEFVEMEAHAREIASWGENVYVKIPVTNTRGEASLDLIRRLSSAGIKLNVTAILALEQVRQVVEALDPDTPSIVSVFAGRIADTGVDPVPLMTKALALCKLKPHCELLWASTRELLNVFQAEQIGCPIITVTPEILKKASLIGMDLSALSLDTVRMFERDARSAGFKIG
ncbi:MAG: transaldolase [candidate division FCPU426 bacterium]